MTESDELKTMKCPWCGEDDFDLVGLKTHLTNLDCESFNRCRRAPRYFKDVSERPVDIEDLVLYRDVQAIEQERDALRSVLIALLREHDSAPDTQGSDAWDAARKLLEGK